MKGIRVRQARPDDAEYIQAQEADIHPDKDTVFLAEISGKPVGCLAVRKIPLVHGFAVEHGVIARRIAAALLLYAGGYVRASGFSEATVYISPENEKMIRWIEEHGARLEDTAQIYTMDVE